MADKVKYKPNTKAAREIMQSLEIQQHTEQVGQKGKAFAESISPEKTGDYKRSFYVDTQIIGDRAQTVLVNNSEHATVVELFNNGTGDRILAKSAEFLKGA